MAVTRRTCDEFNVSVYVPCHFDYSQLEYVAPFLLRHGGKVFMYRWHTHKPRMEAAFRQLAVPVLPFTLEALVRAVFSETRPVVFLLTAAVGNEHGFGASQHRFLSALQGLFPDRIRAVSVVGHCMYSCAFFLLFSFPQAARTHHASQVRLHVMLGRRPQGTRLFYSILPKLASVHDRIGAGAVWRGAA